mmetsp:Transcript_87011/g.243974  ORF Transcript_87011/g.243974 Transcript_87011/m.243974 type:complete len:436 (+) Transcript_87011:90-1397(+)
MPAEEASSSGAANLLPKDTASEEVQAKQMPAGRSMRKAEARVRLDHLTGVKTLLAIWIVMHHMSSREPESAVSIFTMRVDVAVEAFVMLSGFMTHYAYGEKDATSSPGTLLCFYVRRLARVGLTTQFAMLCSLFWWWFGAKDYLTLKVLGCLTFVKPWLDPEPNCPNAPTWFIAATIPSWLLYPLVTRPILDAKKAKESPQTLLTYCGVLWLVSLAPQLVLIVLQGDWLTWAQVKYTWFWPPAQLADFAFGACVAALIKSSPPPKSAGKLADALIMVLFLICFFFPVAETPEGWEGPVFRPGHYMAWDGLSARIASPLIAAWIYCSACNNSYIGQFFSNTVLVALGAYNLEIYLFQTPVHDLFTWTKDALWLPTESMEVFMLYIFLLNVASAMWVDMLAAPADKWLKGVTAEWECKPLSHFFGQRQAYVTVQDAE